jgi:hypothetical protein
LLNKNLKSEAPDPTEIDWPEPAEGVEDGDPLFDSTRGYVEQIDRYKKHQDRPTTGRVRSFALGRKPEAAE